MRVVLLNSLVNGEFCELLQGVVVEDVFFLRWESGDPLGRVTVFIFFFLLFKTDIYCLICILIRG